MTADPDPPPPGSLTGDIPGEWSIGFDDSIPREYRLSAEGPAVSRTITLLNQKGGVGKTSTCFHLSATLAKAGRRRAAGRQRPSGIVDSGFFRA